MNQQYYDALIAPYKNRQKKRLLCSAGLMVLGLALSATGVGAVVCVVAMIYLMLELTRTLSLVSVRNKCLKKLSAEGSLNQIMDSLRYAKKMQVDGMTFAWTDEYLCLPHGVLLPLAQIAWLFPFTHTIRYMMIPVIRSHSCKIYLLDGTFALGFYGKVKDTVAFEALLVELKKVVPQLLIGHSEANQQIYQAMVAAYTQAK